MAKMPKQVVAFQKALERFTAIREVSLGLKALSDYTPRTYSLPGEFGDLPHALLRRTKGGLPDEAWLTVEFELNPDEAGWLTLEFLAWWVRDLSRSGLQVQLRPMALPPQIGGEVQLGRTLKFILDQFVLCPGGDKKPALEALEERASSLASSIDHYEDILRPLLKPTKGKRG